jgi:hypothetical protein
MITYILPYYRASMMLHYHLETWRKYSAEVTAKMRLLIIDDCSPEPAAPIVASYREDKLPIELYRIKEDIPWNRNGARNLGSHLATTPWLLHTDIDHVLPFDSAESLVRSSLDVTRWYRFDRFRVGAADDTRRKDALPKDAMFGRIKPHGDSYLCTKVQYWHVGGYDEDYSGHLGGGTPFLEQMTDKGQPVLLPIPLHVITRSVVPDASVSTLSRDPTHYTKMRARKRAEGNPRGVNPLRFTWERIV